MAHRDSWVSTVRTDPTTPHERDHHREGRGQAAKECCKIFSAIPLSNARAYLDTLTFVREMSWGVEREDVLEAV